MEFQDNHPQPPLGIIPTREHVDNEERSECPFLSHSKRERSQGGRRRESQGDKWTETPEKIEKIRGRECFKKLYVLFELKTFFFERK